jgi:D-alanyl-D-alanine endopeptidase (penicillin-binding protein 7)
VVVKAAMRAGVTVLTGVLGVALSALALRDRSDATPAPPEPPPAPPAEWLPPTWLPDEDLHALGHGMAAQGPRTGPRLRSRCAFVYDPDSDTVLFERNADEIRPVASLTKVVASLAAVRAGGEFDTRFCVDAKQYPTRQGARSRLSTGDCVEGWDVVGAALVASDNRAALGLAEVAGLGMDDFVVEMNRVSAELAMDRSTWTDPSGLEDDNLSTARDMARATLALASHPTLRLVATAEWWDVHREKEARGDVPRRLTTTNKLIGRPGLEFLAAKTGYTDTARYNFTTMLRDATGRRLVITVLGAEGTDTRFADVERVLEWAGRNP